MIDLAGAMLRAAGKQHPLGHRRLAGVDVGNDADVADFGEVSRHVTESRKRSLTQSATKGTKA